MRGSLSGLGMCVLDLAPSGMMARRKLSGTEPEGLRSETIDDAVKIPKSRRGVSVVSDFVRPPDQDTGGSTWERCKQKAGKL